MILQTRTAKIILSVMALVLLACAVFVAVTGWDGSSDTAVLTSASDQAASTPSATSEEPQPALPPTPTEENTSTVSLTGVYLDPQYAEIKPGKEISVNLMANLTGCGISGCEVVFEFDPTIFQLTDVVSGDLLGTDPLIGTSKTDNTTGKVRYAIARKGLTDITASSGVLCTFNLWVYGSAPGGSYDMTIGELILTDHNFEKMTSYSMHNGTVTVVP